MGAQNLLSLLLEFLMPKTERERDIETATAESLTAKLYAQELWGDPSVISLFDYRDKTVKNMIWGLKYKGNTRAAELFAYVLFDYLLEELSDTRIFESAGSPFLIGMPLAKERQKERGFNQTDLVLGKLKVLDTHRAFTFAPKMLLRIKNTPSQTQLQSREERKKNLEGAFRVADRDAVFGKDIIILDDVITTGSTMREAQKTLLRAGARSVLCIGLAH